MLTNERQRLLRLKRTFESHLRSVQNQLQTLDSCRKRLSDVIHERSRATDLTCQAVSSVKGSPNRSKDQNFVAPKTPPVEYLGPYTPETASSMSNAQLARESSASIRKTVNDAMEEANQLQQSTHLSVNHGLTKKVAETVNIKVRGIFLVVPKEINSLLNKTLQKMPLFFSNTCKSALVKQKWPSIKDRGGLIQQNFQWAMHW